MRPRWIRRHLSIGYLLVFAASLALGVQALVGVTVAGATAAPKAQVSQQVSQPPNGVGELDCNGLSPVQRPAKAAVMCTDPRGSDEGRFFDNGHYLGHDEPSVRFVSNQPGSGSDTTFNEQLPLDPAALPTVETPAKTSPTGSSCRSRRGCPRWCVTRTRRR